MIIRKHSVRLLQDVAGSSARLPGTDDRASNIILVSLMDDVESRTDAVEMSMLDTRVRLDHNPKSMTITFGTVRSCWQLTIPDEYLELDSVRIHLRELTSRRGGECSALMAWSDYRHARDWLRCIRDGYPERSEVEPALKSLREAFSDIAQAVSL